MRKRGGEEREESEKGDREKEKHEKKRKGSCDSGVATACHLPMEVACNQRDAASKRKKTEVACKKKVVTIIFACHLPWEVGLEVCIS